MRRVTAIALMLLTTLPVSAAARRGPQMVEPADPSPNAFATDLYAQFASADGNLFFSPVSIQTAIAMTWAGANGRTADEIAKALHFDPHGDTHKRLGAFLDELNSGGKAGGYDLNTANALWLHNGFPFTRDYITFIKETYQARLTPLDFVANADGSRKTINDWVASQTHDRIKELMPSGSINSLTRIVLTNTIYFNGKWTQSFDKNLTQEQDFQTASGKKVKAALMFQEDTFRYGEDDAVQVIELPYGNDQLCMRIFLPRRANGLAALERRFTAPRLAVLADRLKPQKVQVWLPRFTIQSQPPLIDALKAMGMVQAFDPNKANFTAMTPNGNIYLSAVVHNAFIQVNEQGTEAAAATGVVGGLFGIGGQARPDPIVFKADHPFVFAIIHRRTDTMLFIGRLSIPEKNPG